MDTKKNLRDWFKLIYQVLFGDDDGPRMGFFISFFWDKGNCRINKKKNRINVFNIKTIHI